MHLKEENTHEPFTVSECDDETERGALLLFVRRTLFFLSTTFSSNVCPFLAFHDFHVVHEIDTETFGEIVRRIEIITIGCVVFGIGQTVERATTNKRNQFGVDLQYTQP